MARTLEQIVREMLGNQAFEIARLMAALEHATAEAEQKNRGEESKAVE